MYFNENYNQVVFTGKKFEEVTGSETEFFNDQLYSFPIIGEDKVFRKFRNPVVLEVGESLPIFSEEWRQIIRQCEHKAGNVFNVLLNAQLNEVNFTDQFTHADIWLVVEPVRVGDGLIYRLIMDEDVSHYTFPVPTFYFDFEQQTKTKATCRRFAGKKYRVESILSLRQKLCNILKDYAKFFHRHDIHLHIFVDLGDDLTSSTLQTTTMDAVQEFVNNKLG